MKKIYVTDLLRNENYTEVEIYGWVQNQRSHKNIIFLDICDSTGSIQAFVEKSFSTELFDFAKSLKVESAVCAKGLIIKDNNKVSLSLKSVELIGCVLNKLSPQPRSNFDVFNEAITSHVLDYRHIYLRNPKIMAVLKFRDILMHHMRQWFYENRFTSVDAPILTPVPLYEDGSALKINIHGENVFLTQCVGYYLEAAVHAFERVYNMGPSFRGEESRSKRHLMEYWHIKAEMAWGNLEDIISMVENIIKYLTQKCFPDSHEIMQTLGKKMCLDGLKTPFPRITYDCAIKVLQTKGFAIEYGKSLGSAEEAELSNDFNGPFWITGIPRTIEPFPYVIDKKNPKITRVADLIASNGYGELLGVAEKIHTLDMLDERLHDKGKFGDPRFDFVREVHQIGCVPHVAFGMGVERLIRWLIDIPHVRDAIAFPRIFKRKISP
ncbi:MAG: asparagine--tRNA ligase [Patescibacteria group bacterium]